jgi:tetratricopeptide (TPR) repeat protein
MAQLTAGLLHLLKGDWVNALSSIEQCIATYRSAKFVLALPHALASSAWGHAQIGEASEALSRLRECEELLERYAARGAVDQHGQNYRWLGRAALLLNRLEEAQRLGECALQYSPSHPGFAAHAQHLLADIAAHPDRFDAERGEDHYRLALALAEPRGMRPLVAHSHLGLSELYHRVAKQEQADEHFTIATTLYREMDMVLWLEQAGAKRK